MGIYHDLQQLSSSTSVPPGGHGRQGTDVANSWSWRSPSVVRWTFDSSPWAKSFWEQPGTKKTGRFLSNNGEGNTKVGDMMDCCGM